MTRFAFCSYGKLGFTKVAYCSLISDEGRLQIQIRDYTL